MSQIERAGGDDRIAFGAFVLDCPDERLWGPGGPIRLGRKAFLVLQALLSTPGRLVTKEELFSSVWDGTIVSESVLTTVIKELRRALSDDRHDSRWIETVYGRGYRFKGEVRAARQAPASAPAAPPAVDRGVKPPVVRVAAFEDSAVRDLHPWLGAGLREEVLSALARSREIRLIADAPGGAPDDTGPGYHLSASLLPDGAGVRVLARVRRLPDGEIVWAESLALAGGGLAGGVETIVRRIIGAALPAVDEDVLLGLPPGSDGFYARYVGARTISFDARHYADARAAGETLQALIDERPAFGLAYPPLVRLLNTDHGYTGLGTTGPAERTRALALARAGLSADPKHAHAHFVLGFCRLWQGEAELALECFDAALSLNPYNPARLREVASGIMWLGDLDRARALFDESLELQPLADDRYHEDRAELALLSGDLDDARAQLRRVHAPRFWSLLYRALVDPDPAAVSRWRALAAERWVGGSFSAHQIIDWIGFHRAFAAPLKGPFMALVQDRLGNGSEMPISPANAEMKQVIGGGG